MSVDSGTYYVSSFLSFLASTTKLARFMFRTGERTETSPKRILE
jgi:hypothetical protein